MLKKERAEYVSKRLDELYPDPPIPLDHTDSFTLLVAVVLSAQCTDKKVNEVTPALFARASDPQSMSKLPASKVQSLIQTLGLAPQKAKALVGLSKQIMSQHAGDLSLIHI